MRRPGPCGGWSRVRASIGGRGIRRPGQALPQDLIEHAAPFGKERLQCCGGVGIKVTQFFPGIP